MLENFNPKRHVLNISHIDDIVQNTAKTECGRKPGSQSQEEVKTLTSETTRGAVSKALVFFFLMLLPVTTDPSVINQLHALPQTRSSELLLLGRTQL